MKFITSNKLGNYIHSNISEADIFSKYLGISIIDIYKCINDRSHRVNNPLRDDKNPSLGFLYTSVKGKLRLYAKDFANPFFVGDCYYFVGIILGLHTNIPEDFVKICKHIIHNFKITEGRSLIHHEPVVHEEIITSIDIEKREWDKYDIAYWASYGITLDVLNDEQVYPVNKFWVNNRLQDYFYQVTNPCYAYYLGHNKVDLWEIYRPFDEKFNKFRTNDKNDIKELHTVRQTYNLIITKSKKDKLLLKRLIADIKLTKIDVLYTSEANKLKSSTKLIIDENYRNVYVNFDIDMTGINGMRYFHKQYSYNIFPFIVNNFEYAHDYPKDISDFCKRYGYANTLKMFHYLINHYML